MLKPAILYADQIPKLYQGVWFNDKYKYYNYNSYWHTFTVEDTSNKADHQSGDTNNDPNNCGHSK